MGTRAVRQQARRAAQLRVRGLDLAFIREGDRTAALCEIATRQDPRALAHVPLCHLTHGMCWRLADRATCDFGLIPEPLRSAGLCWAVTCTGSRPPKATLPLAYQHFFARHDAGVDDYAKRGGVPRWWPTRGDWETSQRDFEVAKRAMLGGV